MDEQVWFSRSHSINDYWKKIDGYELTPSLQKSLLLKEYNHIVKLIFKFRLRRQIYRNETHNSIFTVIVVCTIVVTAIKVMKKNHKETYMSEGMILGFVIGAISSYYIMNALICTPIGMFLGIEVGKNIRRNS